MSILDVSDVASFLDKADEIGADVLSTKTGLVASLNSITVGYWNSYSSAGKIKTDDFDNCLDLSTVSSRFSARSILDIATQN
jgi:hypothetical protein